MKCRYCGAELREGTLFCHQCGHPVKKEKKTSDNPYVIVSGSEIDLDEKTEIYQKAKLLFLKAIRPPFKAYIPILGLSYLAGLYNKVRETEDKLLSFDNQENIVNAILTDMIFSKLYKIEKAVSKMIFGNILFTLILIIIVIIVVAGAALFARFKSPFFF